MRFSIKQARRQSLARTIGIVFTTATLLIPPSIAAAQSQTPASTNANFSASPLVVRNDRGGLLRERISQLAQLRQESRPVEVRGNICFSTCTMYLGLPNTCVSPNTTFGFHGPSSYGRALDPTTFNNASRIIADHYPPALRTWYMNTARYSLNNLHRVSGSNIIAMGVRAC